MVIMVIDKSENDLALLDRSAFQDTDSLKNITKSERSSENRYEDRVDFRTTGFAYILGKEGFKPTGLPIRVWTVDVSTMGCLIRSYEPIRSDRVLIKLFLPQLKETVIEAYIVRNLQDKTELLNGKNQDSNLYGVKFTKMLPLSELEEELPLPADENSPQEKILRREEAPKPVSVEAEKHSTDPRVITTGLLTLASIVILLLVSFT
jgi:hypothetical protein